MSRKRADAYDCTRCGACCANPEHNRSIGYVDYVQVKPGDAIGEDKKLVRRFVVVNNAGERHMRLDRDEKCAALRGRLGESVECSVYDVRPAVCRALEPGSEACIRARTEHGFEGG